MKRNILFFVSLFSISLFAQNIPDINDFEISPIENGYKFQSKPEEVKFLPPAIDTKDEWDTLYISLDSPTFNIGVIGPYYQYWNTYFTWINSTFGYILLNNEHTYTLCAQWWEPGDDTYWELKENYNINGTDTLEFSRLNSIYEIEMNPVNQNGILIADLEFQKFFKIWLFCPQGEGYYPIGFLHNPGGTSFFSSISENIPILTSSGCYDVLNDNYFCYVEFPPLNGINQNYLLSNNIDDFKQTNVQLYFPNNDVPYSSTGMMNGVSYRNFLGEFDRWATGFSFSWEHTKFWNGQVFLNKHDMGSYKSIVFIAGLEIINMYNDPVSWYVSPYLEMNNDSICTYYNEFPPYNIFNAGSNDTLFFGETPLRVCALWNNNIDVGIRAFFRNYGFFGEHYFYPINNEVEYKLKDSNGNILYEEQGLEYLFYPDALEESYEVEINYLAVPLEDGFGRAKMRANFEYGSFDASPPTITTIQFRNSSNKPVYKINSGEDLTLLFSAADFSDYYINIAGTEYLKYLYQPVMDDATTVYIKEYDEEIWQEVMIENIHEDTVYGIYYQASLSEFINAGNTAYDLKIGIKDLNNNACELVLSPAILVDDFTLSKKEQEQINLGETDISIYPNPTTNKLVITNSENVKINSILLLDSYGKQINQIQANNREIDLTGITSGLYYLKISHEDGEIVKKIIVQ